MDGVGRGRIVALEVRQLKCNDRSSRVIITSRQLCELSQAVIRDFHPCNCS